MRIFYLFNGRLTDLQYYQTMNNKEKIKHILIEVQKLRLKMDIRSQKLQDFLYYQHLKVSGASTSLLWCGICGVPRKQVSQPFKRAFKSLSELQRAQYYLLNVKNANLILNSKTEKIQNETIRSEEQSYKFKVMMKPNLIVKKQSIINIEILRKQKVLKVEQQKIQIDLHKFLFRKSKNKDKNHIVLEATYENSIGETIRIDNCGIQFEDILNTITLVWEEAQFENVYEMIHRRAEKNGERTNNTLKSLKPKSEMMQCSTKKTQNNSKEQKSYKLLFNDQQENVEWYQQIIQSFSCFKDFNETKFGENHQKKGLRVRKSIILINFSNGTQNIMNLLKSQAGVAFLKPAIKTIKISNQTSSSNPNLFLIEQVHEIEGKQCKFTYCRSFANYHGALYILDRNYNVSKSQNNTNINHCIWRIRDNGSSMQILVQAKIQYFKIWKDISEKRKATSYFIGDLNKIAEDVILSKKKFDLEEQEQMLSYANDQQQVFYTVAGSLVDEPRPQIVLSSQFIDDIQMSSSKLQQNKPNEKSIKTMIKQVSQIDSNGQSVLSFKHIKFPALKSAPELIVPPDNKHWLWQDQWVIRQNGDLVNIDQEKIDVQSSVLKLVVKNMGRNLFSGKSILNTSLPIQIFGTDSNLQRLAGGYIFAPAFLQSASICPNPVDRLKSCISFAIGFSLAYIKMQKPFNPILGQTYQGLIDGCPVYAEQISHHPPISSLYMVGRGYHVYGSFEAKVQLGLNTAAGLNQGFNNVEFQKFRGRVRFTSPPGELSGLIYGDRKITVNKKSYYFDEENHLFCQLQWGRNKSSKSQFAKYSDFFTGKIVKLKTAPTESNYKNIKQSQTLQQIGQIHGRLTQFLYYNSDLLFDVRQKNPYKMKDYSPCLTSDSRNRSDIIYRKLKDYIKAQEAKEELEVLQRKDKKNRAQAK